MSLSSYLAMVRTTYPIVEISDRVVLVPTYTTNDKHQMLVRVAEYEVVEQKRVQTGDGSTIVTVCSCDAMRSLRESLCHAHLHPTSEMVRAGCFHVEAVLAIETRVKPEMSVDDVHRISRKVFALEADDQVVLLKKTRKKGRACLSCLACRHQECVHVRRVETVAIDHEALDVRVDDETRPAPVRQAILPDAIHVPQQKIAMAPRPCDIGKRVRDRSGRVARVYDVGGWTEYVYADGETLDGLRSSRCDRVFRYSREVWFTHALVGLFVDNVARGNPCFDSFHHTMTLQYARAGQQFCSRPTTRTVLQAAMYHLDLDVARTLTCDVCRSMSLRDRVFILDGTSNGFLNRSKTPHVETRGEDQTLRHAPGHVYALVKTNKERAAVLQAFERGKAFDTGAYLKGLGKVAVPGLATFAAHALDRCGAGAVAAFLRDIASPYPLIATVQYGMVLPRGRSLLDRLLQTITSEDRHELRYTWPSLFRLLANFKTIPNEWRRLFQAIRAVAESSYRTEIDYLHWAKADREHPFVCFPDFPRLRRNPWPRGAPREQAESSCTKHILQHRHFSPGLFLVCCPHAKILGFCAMQEYESVHTAFELIVERFEVPPGMIVYDNGCNLFRYGMMRCPSMFRQIRVLIDRFHSPGHVLCPPTFTFGYYPGDTPAGGATFDEINTQAVEQTNGRLRKFQQSLGFMTQENYISFVRVISCLLNMYSFS